MTQTAAARMKTTTLSTAAADEGSDENDSLLVAYDANSIVSL